MKHSTALALIVSAVILAAALINHTNRLERMHRSTTDFIEYCQYMDAIRHGEGGINRGSLNVRLAERRR